MFTAVFLYGFVYPLYTRLGCCGKCKPSKERLQDTDHITDQPGKEKAPAEMIRTLSLQIERLQTQLNVLSPNPPVDA